MAYFDAKLYAPCSMRLALCSPLYALRSMPYALCGSPTFSMNQRLLCFP